jgi:hypothetical protein
VVDDAGSAQALSLLGELYGQVAEISHKLEAAEARVRRARARGNTRKDPVANILRRDLYEAHRLIDGLHRRYPQTAPDSRGPGAATTAEWPALSRASRAEAGLQDHFAIRRRATGTGPSDHGRRTGDREASARLTHRDGFTE